MAGRIVLFGATGYTGKLTAEALVERGAKPVLAARNAQRLEALASELGGLETQIADVSRPETVNALVGEGDVMLSTVGPFARWGAPAVEAAIAASATYIDSTGEADFIRNVFDHHGPRAERAECALMTALGYDWVPGNLAGALALEQAGERATRVDVGYFITGDVGPSGMSGGTRASAAGVVLAPGFAWRGGRIVTVRTAKHVHKFAVNGRDLAGVSAAATEHFALPRSYPQLRDVNVYLGWFGPASRAMQAMTAAMSAVQKIPRVTGAIDTAIGRFVKGSTGGPDAEQRSKSGSHIAAITYDAGGKELSRIDVTGVDGYTFTGRMLAWAAMQAAEQGGVKATGALGPVQAFGLQELQAGVAEAGLEVASSGQPAGVRALVG